MPEWMRSGIEPLVSVSWEMLLVRLATALLFGLGITAIYKGTRRRVGSAVTFPATLVLLCILIAMVTQVIGDNVARAFSLVGALSIVRFRTVVRDTKDTAFVIFAVVVGMSIGAGQPILALIGIAVVGMAAALFHDRSEALIPFSGETLLTVRLTWSQPLELLVVEAISKHASEVQPESVSTIRHGAAMELAYRLRLLSTARPTTLVAELNRIEGVQSIELHSQRAE